MFNLLKPSLTHCRKLLINRCDNLGDVVLTLYMVEAIKAHYPNITILFLGRKYVAPIIDACPYIDKFIACDSIPKNQNQAIAQIKNHHIDAVIHVYPNKKIAFLCKQAKIKTRIGVSRRWYHLLSCNRFCNFSRASSQQHEALLNFKLLKHFNIHPPASISDLTNKKIFKHPQILNNKISGILNKNKFNLVLHPFSNGNGRLWPAKNYLALIQELPASQYNIILSGTPKELPLIEQSGLLNFPNVNNIVGKHTLPDFLLLLQHIDGVVVSSTGPLHLAAALGARVLGLFPPKQTMNTNRWGPIGPNAQSLQQNQSCQLSCSNQDCLCMQNISIEKVKTIIVSWQQK